MQAALDVFNVEPPPADSPLVNRQDVVCTPHLGASTTEAQEGVAVEIADAVIGALKVSLHCCHPVLLAQQLLQSIVATHICGQLALLLHWVRVP